MEARVARLEDDMREVKAILAQMLPMIIRIDATMAHLATKAELAQLRSDLSSEIAQVRSDVSSEIAQVRSDLSSAIADKPGKVYLWGVLAVLLAAYAARLAPVAPIR
jgi:predicted  nucleic acid-binding Zn-ribbon protein